MQERFQDTGRGPNQYPQGIFVLTEKDRAKLIEANRKALERMPTIAKGEDEAWRWKSTSAWRLSFAPIAQMGKHVRFIAAGCKSSKSRRTTNDAIVRTHLADVIASLLDCRTRIACALSMIPSRNPTITDASEQLCLLRKAPAFRKLCRVGIELSEHRKFNLFRFADKTISENAWSRIFAWLLNSTEDHGLKLRPFRLWLHNGPGEEVGAKNFSRHLHAVLTTTEFPTEEGRRIDVLINVLDKRSRTIAVIGVENKVWSGEQRFQVSDYQADLNSRFRGPKIVKRLVFLTPEGGEAATADSNSDCKYVPASYDTITDLCQALARGKDCNPNLLGLLNQMKSYLETEITKTSAARQLVQRLYADEKYRAALRLIAQYKPSTYDVFVEVKKSVEKELRRRKIKYRWYPGRGTGRPYDIRLIPAALTFRGQAPFEVNYILTCDKDEPDVGDTFKLIVTAWCGNKAAVRKAKKLVLSPRSTPWREHTRRVWVTIWVGSDYRLKDLGRADAKALSIRLVNAVDQTHNRLRKRAERM